MEGGGALGVAGSGASDFVDDGASPSVGHGATKTGGSGAAGVAGGSGAAQRILGMGTGKATRSVTADAVPSLWWGGRRGKAPMNGGGGWGGGIAETQRLVERGRLWDLAEVRRRTRDGGERWQGLGKGSRRDKVHGRPGDPPAVKRWQERGEGWPGDATGARPGLPSCGPVAIGRGEVVEEAQEQGLTGYDYQRSHP